MGKKRRSLTGQTSKAASDFLVPTGGKLGQNLAMRAQSMQTHFGVSGPDATSLGPGSPPPPAPFDSTGLPRQYAYRPGWNIPTSPGEGRISLETLRALADTYDLLRKAIEVRKDELVTCQLHFIARDPDKTKAKQIIKDQQEKIDQLREFFISPDKKNTWQAWLRMLLEQHFVYDAVPIYMWRKLGGKLHALRLLNGPEIKPLLTVSGERPDPPDWAYQQFQYGVPVAAFTSDELTYAVKNRRVHTPYGFSHVEAFIWHVTLALRFNRYSLDYFTDGTMPEGVATAPEGWTPEQIAAYQDNWNAMLAGDSRALRKLQWVPAGFKFQALKEYTYNEAFARWLAAVTAAAMDITIEELGFEPAGRGLGGKGFAEEQAKTLKRKSTAPLIRWICDEILNPVIWKEFGATDLQAMLKIEGEEEEQLALMQARDLAIRNGTQSIDEVVSADGGEPPGIGRIFVVGGGIFGEPDLIRISRQGTGGGGVAGTPPSGPGASSPSGAGGTPDGTAGHPESPNLLPNRPHQQPGHPLAQLQQPTAQPPNAFERTFFRFVEKRRKDGRWRDFADDQIEPGLLKRLNLAAQSGATDEDLRALMGTGMASQPEPFRKRVQTVERTYRAFGSLMAAAVSERLREVEA